MWDTSGKTISALCIYLLKADDRSIPLPAHLGSDYSPLLPTWEGCFNKKKCWGGRRGWSSHLSDELLWLCQLTLTDRHTFAWGICFLGLLSLLKISGASPFSQRCTLFAFLSLRIALCGWAVPMLCPGARRLLGGRGGTGAEAEWPTDWLAHRNDLNPSILFHLCLTVVTVALALNPLLSVPNGCK